MKKTVSILKEVINGENRVILLPQDIEEITEKYDLMIESGCGERLGYSDEEYIKRGARIASKEECWNADFILKYKGPTVDEFKYLNENTRLGAIFHAEGREELIREMINKKITAYTYEFLETSDGYFPMAFPGGEIAGKMGVLYANHFAQIQFGGQGRALFSIRGAKKSKIAVIGYGNVGGAAIKMAKELGNDVYVFGSNISKLKKLSVHMDEDVHCIESTEENLKKYLPEMDAIIGAILISTYDTPALITEEMFNMLRPGTVVVDVTCGYGKGYLPSIDRYTNLNDPFYVTDNGIVCVKIDNLPSAYSVSTTEAYSNNAKQWLLQILDHEFGVKESDIAERGKIMNHGEIVHDVIAEHWRYYNEHNN